MNETTVAPKTNRALLDTAKRALVFVQTITSVHAIRVLLQPAGYTDEEHAFGWTLVRRVFGLAITGVQEAPTDSIDAPVHDAIRQIVEWAKTSFIRMQAALTRLHPDQGAFLFEGLAPTNDSETVQAVRTLLDRLDELESSPARKATHKADQATLKTLATRSYTPEERKRVRALVDDAQGETKTTNPPTPTKKTSDKKADQTHADLVALDAWYTDWSTTAKEVITRRDYRIRLGIAKRRKSEAQRARAAELVAEKKAKKAKQAQPAPKTKDEAPQAAKDAAPVAGAPTETTASEASTLKATPTNGQSGRAGSQKSSAQKTAP